jgi:hypothetical protein
VSNAQPHMSVERGEDLVALPPTWSLRVGKLNFTYVADDGATVAP